MINNKQNYKVYVHVFPDGKRYVGCTCQEPKARWSGGLGYQRGTKVFRAILKYGWNNIRHYVLMDNLTRDEALLYESAFIHGWKTYTKSYGYNTIAPKIDGSDEINIPTFRECKKKKVLDVYDIEVDVRLKLRDQAFSRRAKKVRCIETGEVFLCADTAAFCFGYRCGATISNAIKTGRPAGRVEKYSEEYHMEYTVPAHWEYVD